MYQQEITSCLVHNRGQIVIRVSLLLKCIHSIVFISTKRNDFTYDPSTKNYQLTMQCHLYRQEPKCPFTLLLEAKTPDYDDETFYLSSNWRVLENPDAIEHKFWDEEPTQTTITRNRNDTLACRVLYSLFHRKAIRADLNKQSSYSGFSRYQR